MNELLARKARALLSLCLMLAVAGAGPARAQSPTDNLQLCKAPGIVFLFFNGVQTTRDGADISLQEFKRLHGSTSPAGERIRYEYLYNYSDGFEDFVETFEQRLLEQEELLEGRYELFFEALRGEGPWLSRIVESVPRAAVLLNEFGDWCRAALAQQLTRLFADPPTQLNYAEHRLRLDNFLLEGNKLLLVAHSQGNLFVNPAYQYALTKVTAESVKVVHIAPASPSLNGPHTLADLDLVINGLRAVGDVADVTDNIPGYLLRPAGVSGKTDPLGHGLLEIYLNPSLAISQRVNAHIMNALETLKSPPATASQGFFTATLTWDGIGDVDLHVDEPSGVHVYYSQMRGDAGFLDVDNTIEDGPEHYYADCDANQLQEGTYVISVANYSGPARRKATVQIASSSDGVLGTKSVVLGEATGDVPSETLFNVAVTRDPETKKYSVALGP